MGTEKYSLSHFFCDTRQNWINCPAYDQSKGGYSGGYGNSSSNYVDKSLKEHLIDLFCLSAESSRKNRIISLLLIVISVILFFNGKGNFYPGRLSGLLFAGNVYWSDFKTTFIWLVVFFLLVFYLSKDRRVLRTICLIVGVILSLTITIKGISISLIFVMSGLCSLGSILLAYKYHK